MDIRASDVLSRLSGAHRVIEKLVACGYELRSDPKPLQVLDGPIAVASLVGTTLTSTGNLSDRMLTEQQWHRFLAIDRERIVVHEVGHAVIALRDQLGLAHVLVAEEEQWGETCFSHKASSLPVDHPRHDPVVMRRFFAAGAAAEVAIWGGYNRFGAATDETNFNRFTEATDEIRFADAVQTVALNLSAKTILRIAAVLNETGYLSRHRVQLLSETYG